MMGVFRILLSIIVATLLTSAAHADWHRASSDHFVIYADQKEEQVRDFSQRLERFHSATISILGRESVKPSPSNRVTIFIVSNTDQVQKLAGAGSRNIAGFYVPRAGGTIAIVPKIQSGASEFDMSGLTVLLHEYAHHVMYGNSAFGYPLWYSEGFAEFFAAAAFEKDGAVGLGRPANHRAYELVLANDVPIERLLDTKAYLAKKEKSSSYDEFYGRSWLLFHYLTFSETRKGQMSKFLKAMGEGQSDIDAAKQEFGDLKALNNELERYFKQRTMKYIRLGAAGLKTGDIAIQKLDPAEAAIMPFRIRSKRGVDEEMAKKLLGEMRPVAAKFPSSAPVLAALAEAEFDAGFDDIALAAADKALAIDPKNIDALVQKGNVLVRQAESASDKKKAWAAVRRHYVKINQIENDHPVPLIRYYQSYAEADEKPTSNALEGLGWALQLSPFDKGLRLNVGNALIDAEKFDDAKMVLEPLAKDGHQPEMAELATKMIAVAESKKLALEADAKAEAAPPAKAAPKK